MCSDAIVWEINEGMRRLVLALRWKKIRNKERIFLFAASNGCTLYLSRYEGFQILRNIIDEGRDFYEVFGGEKLI